MADNGPDNLASGNDRPPKPKDGWKLNLSMEQIAELANLEGRAEIVVALAYKWHARSNGVAYPSTDKIVEELGHHLSKSTVRRAKASLIKRRVLTPIRKASQHAPPVYQVNLSGCPADEHPTNAPECSTGEHSEDTSGCSSGNARVFIGACQGVHPGTPECSTGEHQIPALIPSRENNQQHQSAHDVAGPDSLSEEEKQGVTLLRSLGVSPEMAQKLSRKLAPRVIGRIVRECKGGNLRNPAGLVVKQCRAEIESGTIAAEIRVELVREERRRGQLAKAAEDAERERAEYQRQAAARAKAIAEAREREEAAKAKAEAELTGWLNEHKAELPSLTEAFFATDALHRLYYAKCAAGPDPLRNLSLARAIMNAVRDGRIGVPATGGVM